MKYVKILSLAAVIGALMAFLGAGTASATTICKTTTTPCTSLATTIHKELTSKVIIESAGSSITECKKSTIHKQIATQGSTTTVSGKISSLSWEECTNPTTTVTNGEFEIHHIAGTDNGTLTLRGTEFTINGVFGVSCTYTATDVGTVVGGSPAAIKISAIVKKSAGSVICPSEPSWTAEYKATEPNPLYVESS